METKGGAGTPELKKAPKKKHLDPLGQLNVQSLNPNEEEGEEEEQEEGGIPIPVSGLLQVTERRQPLSSVSSLEVHFDLLDLTELTDMSDQELAEVFADSDDENTQSETAPGLQPIPHLRGACLRSPSWTRMKVDPGKEKKPDLELQKEHLKEPFLTVERPQED
ncbi:dysbindin domain-containing protein 1 [Protopterus annectens]|uniref:dysbindin domain-containing protein 1 n=1 Tax=Protopterus annectens TaxID=7888 RepID=UPI001CFB064E|nr:dysbindin domain-containing protein 1 [Protopterus annectens]